jgi:hypothetical protein
MILDSSIVEFGTQTKSMSQENYFHPEIDNKIYEKIAYNDPNKVLKAVIKEKGCLIVADTFKSKLYKTRLLLAQYQKFLKSLNKKENSISMLTIAILSGYDFTLESSKLTPFIEITQDIDHLPEEYRSRITGETSIGTDSNENQLTSTSEPSQDKDLCLRFDAITSNKLIHSTRIP